MQAATAPRAYCIVPAAGLLARGLAEMSTVDPAAPNPDDIPVYGEIRTHSIGHKHIADPVCRLVLRDAVVHGADGVVTTGRYALAESLVRVLPDRVGAWRDDGLWMTLHDHVGTSLPAAEHLLCGDPANYCHWLLDGLARACCMPNAGLPVLMPNLDRAFLRSGAALLPSGTGRPVPLGPNQAAQVGQLGWTSTLTNYGGAYHPALRRFGHAARPPALLDGPEAIYVSRRDTPRRVLANEAAVEQLCAARGFVTVVASGLSVAEQAAVFAGARRIVAPHGAALANLLFCRPGAAVLELLMDNYVNFCFRQFAACMGLRYGCVLGCAGPGDPAWVHATSWTVDLDRLAAAIDDPRFSADPREDIG